MRILLTFTAAAFIAMTFAAKADTSNLQQDMSGVNCPTLFEDGENVFDCGSQGEIISTTDADGNITFTGTETKKESWNKYLQDAPKNEVTVNSDTPVTYAALGGGTGGSISDATVEDILTPTPADVAAITSTTETEATVTVPEVAAPATTVPTKAKRTQKPKPQAKAPAKKVKIARNSGEKRPEICAQMRTKANPKKWYPGAENANALFAQEWQNMRCNGNLPTYKAKITFKVIYE